MDSLTLKILRLFYWPNENLRERPSYWAISKAIDYPPATIKRHIEALVDEKVMNGFIVIPHTSLMGLRRSMVVADSESGVIENIKQNLDILDFIQCLYTGPGKTIVLDIFHRADLNRKLEYVQRLCGRFESTRIYDLIEETKNFRSTDKEVARHLMKNPFARITELCNLTNLSRSSVSKSLNRIFENRILDYVPELNSYNLQEGFLAFFLFSVENVKKQKSCSALNEISNENIISLCSNFDGLLTAVFEFRTFGELESLKKKMSKLDNLKIIDYMSPFTMVTNVRGLQERFSFINDELLGKANKAAVLQKMASERY